MSTMIISTLVGLFQGLATESMKIVKEYFAAKMEIEYMKEMANVDILRKKHGIVYSQDGLVEGEVPDSFTLPVSFAKSGFTKIDKFNALMRPLVSAIAIIVFVALVACIAYLVILDQTTDLSSKVTMLQSGLIADFILSVLGFLFGYRSAVKLKGR